MTPENLTTWRLALHELLVVAQDAHRYFATFTTSLPSLTDTDLRFSQREPAALRDRLKAAIAQATSPQGPGHNENKQ